LKVLLGVNRSFISPHILVLQVLFYADSLIPTIKSALVDELPEVREAAASTFDSLHTCIGQRALDDILPDLLGKLDSDPGMSERALDGLKQVMIVKSRFVLPYLVPQVRRANCFIV